MAQRIRRRVWRPPGSTKARGYDADHKKRRAAALAAMPEGAPCSRCDRPMYSWQPLHLDHDDYDRSSYLGLSHASCNVAASNRSPRRRLSRAAAAPASTPLRTSRRW
ncbi:MAG TPA: hypothetical protein VGF32_24645 [Streptosporangiaceae bacterium]